MWVQHWWSTRMAEEIAASVEQWRPDVVHFEMSVMTPYLLALADFDQSAKRVLTVYDPSGPAAQVELVRHSGLRWLAHALDVRAWRINDLAAARAADAVVFFTEDDVATQAPRLGSTPPFVIPLGIRIPEVALSPVGTDPNTAVFVGSGLHPPNIDAVEWLGNMLPRLNAAVPGARVVIVGDFRGVGTHDHLDVRGRVPDVAIEMDRAALVVAPLRLGGGMRVKVLEALAAGKAVVATSKALAGLSAAREGAAVAADDDDAFVDAVARLLGDDAARRELGTNARSWAQANLSWSSRLPLYESMYAHIGVPAGHTGHIAGSVPHAAL
jgi:glycosyltransferase involved in cell wall biosynthesis